MVIALIDYDNIRANKRETSVLDTSVNVALIADAVSAASKDLPSAEGEVRLRFYGGWVDEHGHFTVRAQWLMRAIGEMRRRHRGILVVPDLVTELVQLTSVKLVGTCRRSQTPSVQKMVDTMMTVDALHFAGQAATSVLVASDDDDSVPALLAGQSHPHSPMHILRRRSRGTGLNDSACAGCGVKFLTVPPEYPR